jgi:hypothetical protein
VLLQLLFAFASVYCLSAHPQRISVRLHALWLFFPDGGSLFPAHSRLTSGRALLFFTYCLAAIIGQAPFVQNGADNGVLSQRQVKKKKTAGGKRISPCIALCWSPFAFASAAIRWLSSSSRHRHTTRCAAPVAHDIYPSLLTHRRLRRVG